MGYDIKMPFVTLLAQWLATLPKPCGVMCDSYFLAKNVFSACRHQNLAIPQEIAMITVKTEADETAPEPLPLSYIKLNTHRKGYEAAAWLEQLMSGARAEPGARRWIAPLGIETRQSTDVLASADPQMAKALRYIWLHACEGIRVDDVLRTLRQSRSVFEKRFQKIVGRTPHDEIVRVQMNQVKTLLTGTNLSLEEIAQRTGFSHVQYLSERFQQITGVRPSKYRAVHGANLAALPLESAKKCK